MKDPTKAKYKLFFCLQFSGTIKGWSPAVTILALNRVAALDLMAQSKINTCRYKKSMEHKLGSEYFLTQAPTSDCLGASHIVGQWKEQATLLSIRAVGLHYVLFLVLFIDLQLMNWSMTILSKVFKDFTTKMLPKSFSLWLEKYVRLIQAQGLLGIRILSI